MSTFGVFRERDRLNFGLFASSAKCARRRDAVRPRSISAASSSRYRAIRSLYSCGMLGTITVVG